MTLRLFLTAWILYALHFATNTVREVYPALSLGDSLSFDVSEYAGLHPDIFEVPCRGAFINNNPGASIVGAVPYALARPAIDLASDYARKRRAAASLEDPPRYESPWPMAQEFYRRAREHHLDVKFGLGAAVMQAFAMAPLSALSAVVIFWILRSRTGSPRAALLLALLYAFATPVFYRTAQLNQNLLVAHSSLFAFALLWRPWDAPGAERRPAYFAAGLLSGWAVVCDYTGLVTVLVLGGYTLLRWRGLSPRRPWDLVRFGGGLALSGAVLMAYQWSSFGNPFLPAQFHMPPPPHGYSGLSWPDPALLWRNAFDPRFGLFVSAPLLFLAFWMPGWLPGRRALLKRREALCCASFALALFLFSSIIPFCYLQFNTGVRHLVPAVPFLFLLAASVLVRLPRLAAIPMALAAAYWSWCLAMYRDVERGRGVLEAIVEVTTGGPRLPWLTTLERLGYLRGPWWPAAALAGAALLVAAIWSAGRLLPAAPRALEPRQHLRQKQP